MKKHEYLYFFMLYFLYFLYFLLFLGFDYLDIFDYISTINIFVRLYVCGFLILRFNPFRENQSFTEFDRKIVFSSAIFLLTTIGITDLYILRNQSKRSTKNLIDDLHNNLRLIKF
jgi:hypothetical protein